MAIRAQEWISRLERFATNQTDLNALGIFPHRLEVIQLFRQIPDEVDPRIIYRSKSTLVAMAAAGNAFAVRILLERGAHPKEDLHLRIPGEEKYKQRFSALQGAQQGLKKQRAFIQEIKRDENINTKEKQRLILSLRQLIQEYLETIQMLSQ